MISALRLHHFTGLQFTQGVLEIGERTLRVPDSGIVASEYIRVVGGLTNELGCLEDLALCLDTFVDILDLLVQLVRLRKAVSDELETDFEDITMTTQSELSRRVRRGGMKVRDRPLNALAVVAGGAVICVRLLVIHTAALGLSDKLNRRLKLI